MRRYRILHRTYYNFSDEVQLGLHELRLRPRESHQLRIESAILEIVPKAILHWRRDVEDNCVAIASFATSTRQLSIVSDLVVQQYNETSETRDDVPRYPFVYEACDLPLLDPYLACVAAPPGNTFAQWVEHARSLRTEGDVVAMLRRLCRFTNEKLAYRIREEAGTQSAEDTLRLGGGSCRDFARLFMETARQLGLAARFVSGYLHAPPTPYNYGATHAWVEVYVPGAGWKGFDPTLGVATEVDHFPVAVARDPERAPPIAGLISGRAQSTLEVGVWVSRLPEAPGI